MGKKIIQVYLALSLVTVAAAALSGSVSAQTTLLREKAYGAAGLDRMRIQLEFLTDSICGGRATGTAGSSETIFWLNRRFRKIGLLPMLESGYVQGFDTQVGPRGHNVIGMMGGGREGNDSYVVVMAHFDGLGKLEGKLYPGADSNASGVVCMLSAAEMLKKMKGFKTNYKRNFIFVGLDAKGMGMAGAYSLWDEIASGKLIDPVSGLAVTPEKIALVINIDQIGCSMSPLKKGWTQYMIVLGLAGNEPLKNKLTRCNLRYDVGIDLAFDYYGSRDFTELFLRKVSDQRVFLENGVPAVLLTSGLTMNNNKPYDNVESLNLRVLHRRTMLLFHWLENI